MFPEMLRIGVKKSKYQMPCTVPTSDLKKRKGAAEFERLFFVMLCTQFKHNECGCSIR